jgi:hypothetical protein
MKAISAILLAMLLALGLASSSNAAEFIWKNYGGAPYASSAQAAMDTREAAFRCLGIDPKLIPDFVRLTSVHGRRVVVNNDERYDKMLSKGCVVHEHVRVAFVAPAKNMQAAAPAERWEHQEGEWLYTLTLHDVCGNWAITVTHVTPPPVVVEVKCKWLHVRWVHTAELHTVLAARRHYPHSPCVGMKMGVGQHSVVSNCGTCSFKAALEALRHPDSNPEHERLLNLQSGALRIVCDVAGPNGLCDATIQVPVSAGEREDDDNNLFCLRYPDGTESIVVDLSWKSLYEEDNAYLGWAPEDWHGLLHTWEIG